MKLLGLNISTQRGLQKTVDGAVSKSLTALAQAFRRGDDVGGGAGLTSAYQQSTWVYACVSAIAQQIAQIPFRFSRVDKSPNTQTPKHPRGRRKAMGETIVESGPVAALFERPHPQLNRFQFWELLVSWLQLRGEFFAVPLDGAFKPNFKPTMLAVLSPDSFREVVRANLLTNWRYTGSGQQSPAPTMDLLPEEVITDRLANPYDFWRGMSPLTVARLAASSDYASAMFEKGLMTNNADTGVIVTTDQQADEPQREAILAALRARKRKAGTADRPLFLWGGAKLEKPTISSADLQFLENRKFKRQEICAVFKVPQEILGFTEDANRSVSESARLNWIENSVSPLCERIEAALDPFIKAQDPALWGWFDIEALPIMQAARRERYAGAVQAFGIGVPIDDCSEIFDLGLPDDLPHAGKSYLPFSLQEVGAEGMEGTDGTETTEEPADGFARAGRLLAAIGNRQSAIGNGETHICAPNPEYEASIAGSVKGKAGALRKFFFEQRGRVLAKLNAETLKSEMLKSEQRTLDDLFDKAKENEALMARLRSRLIADLEFGGAQLFKEIGAVDFNLPPHDALNFLGKRHKPIADINNTTWDRLKAGLQTGITAGETFEQLSDRVKAVYTDASQQRADTIAFTETNIAVNSGRHTAMVQAKVERKGWQTSHLEGTRVSHIANEQLSKENNGIPTAELWPNGLMYPGDPSGEPGETINCRCFGFAVLGEKQKAESGKQKLLGWEEWLAVREGGTQ